MSEVPAVVAAMNAKRKGAKNEHRSRLLLEAAGYAVTRAAASLSAWDLIGVGSTDFVLVQIKSNEWPRSPEMMEALLQLQGAAALSAAGPSVPGPTACLLGRAGGVAVGPPTKSLAGRSTISAFHRPWPPNSAVWTSTGVSSARASY